MYTQCPKCETVFHITMEQLSAHGGVVRCGQCDHIFNADQRLFDEIPPKPREKPAALKKPRVAASNKIKPPKLKTAPATPPAKPARTPKKERAAEITEEVEAAPAPWMPPVDETAVIESDIRTEKRRAGAPARAKHVAETEQVPIRAHPRRFSFLWIVGILLLATVFAAQAAYFYRDRLAAYPELRPLLVEICAEIGCSVRPPYDASRIELVQPTNIAPHPRYANALRLRATLVNRAGKPQPLPLMQVTLTDSSGRVLSRRAFTPAQYLEQRAAASSDMAPHLAIAALLDVANPDGKAVGYQIDFFAPPID